MIKLYFAYPACSMATHIALEESGLPYEPVAVDVYDSEARAEYVKINPKGTVPAITVDGELLTENVAILSYIGALAPNSGLLPKEPMAAAQCISFLAWCSSTAHIAFRQSFRPARFSADATALPSIQAMGRDAYWKALTIMDAKLADQPYIMGKYSLADTYPLVFYNWGLIGDYPVADLANLAAFKDRMIARPAVRRVLEREGCPLIA